MLTSTPLPPPVSPCAFHMFCILDAFREEGCKTRAGCEFQKALMRSTLGVFVSWERSLLCAPALTPPAAPRGSRASRLVMPLGKRLLGFHLSAGPDWQAVVNWSWREHCRLVQLKEKQCESNLTGLLITRLIFQTLCIVTGWRGEEFL